MADSASTIDGKKAGGQANYLTQLGNGVSFLTSKMESGKRMTNTTENVDQVLWQEVEIRLGQKETRENSMRLHQAWASRAEPFERLTTIHSQERQRRLLLLLALPEKQRIQTFNIIAERLNWKSSTRDTYFASLVKAAQIIDEPTTKISAANQKILARKARSTETWTTENFCQFTTPETIRQIEQLEMEIFFPVIVTFWLGQRIGDVLRWQTRNIVPRHFPSQMPTISITVVESKTTDSTGPYSLHVPANGKIGRIISQSKNNSTGPYLFLTPKATLEKKDLDQVLVEKERLIHAALKKAGLDMDFRALRRGGLAQMSAAGWAKEQIRTFSRHKSNEMLDIYLARGSLDGGMAILHTKMLASIEQDVNPMVQNAKMF